MRTAGWILFTALVFWLQCALPALAAANPSLVAFERGIDQGPGTTGQSGLRIARMRVSVSVVGKLADVTIEATLVNEADVINEARFTLTLPPDAVVTGYALDVDGKLIDGTLVDQPKARNVYEDEVRKGIDPGLAEMKAENLFQTRVYPIAPDRARTIRLSYSAPLPADGGVIVPLAFDTPLDALSVTVSVGDYKTAPVITFAGKTIALTGRSGSLSGSWSGEKVALAAGLAVQGGTVMPGVLVTHHRKGGDFFQIGGTFEAAPAAAPAIDRLRIYWDRSLSRRDDLLAREIDLVVSHVASTKPAAIDLVTFASDAPQIETVADTAALRQALERVTYRGGTSFARLDALKLVEADQCLLFTDGLPTVEGDAEFQPDCRTTIIASAPEANGARLGALAQRLRGQLLRLTESNAAELGAALARTPVTVVAVRSDGGERLPFRMLRTGQSQWVVVGRMPDQGSEGVIRLRIAGLRKGIVEQIHGLAAPEAGAHDAEAVLWARQEIEALSESPLWHERMTRLAQTYQVAGTGMAFLVLESPQQYLAADIRPPASFPSEWQDTYRTQRAEREKERADNRQRRLAFVLEEWNARKAWWNTRFTANPRQKARPPRRAGALFNAPAPAMEAPPPPAAVAAPARIETMPSPSQPQNAATAASAESRGDDSEVIVTATRRTSSQQAVPIPVTSLSGRDASGKVIALDLADVLSSQPYLAALKAAAPDRRLAVLAEQEKTFGSLPAFYLETAEWFRVAGDAATARALLLSALELASTDDETRQVVAFRLQRDGDLDRAIEMFERIAASTSFRPQPKRDLALALAERGRSRGSGGRADLERAFTLLTSVALDPVIGDFDGIETIALMEANALIPALDVVGADWSLDPRLVALLDTDVRIVIEWTNDDADIDLWVTEPNSEMVYYSHKLSSAGGTITNDMTQGYGPEEYAIRRAPIGDYVIRINGFDADRLNPNGNGRVLVRMIRDYGRKTQREVLLDADVAFEKGADRDAEGGKRIAKLTVANAPQP